MYKGGCPQQMMQIPAKNADQKPNANGIAVIEC